MPQYARRAAVQISASLHAALKTRPIKIKKKKHPSAGGADGGGAPGAKSEDGGGGEGVKEEEGAAAEAPKPAAPEVKMDGEPRGRCRNWIAQGYLADSRAPWGLA